MWLFFSSLGESVIVLGDGKLILGRNAMRGRLPYPSYLEKDRCQGTKQFIEGLGHQGADGLLTLVALRTRRVGIKLVVLFKLETTGGA